MAYAELTDAKHIVEIGDTHTASTVALCPSDHWDLDDGWSVNLSNAHRMLDALWKYFWTVFVPLATNGEPYIIIHKGDATEGVHHKNTQIFSKRMKDQRAMAETLLRPVLETGKRWYCIRGTEAHDGEDHTDIETIAENLKAVKLEGHHSHNDLWIDWNGKFVHYAHHVGAGSTVQTQASAIARELMLGLVEASQWEDLKPHVVSRAHVHRQVEVSYPAAHGRMLAYTTPSWKLKDSHTHKHFRLNRPQIGGSVLSWDATTGNPVARHFAWAPPIRGPVPTTLDAVKRLISTGKLSSKKHADGQRKAGQRV